jgi:endonuclease/exonuclease/phosphatase family metal-dependent hydrolase
MVRGLLHRLAFAFACFDGAALASPSSGVHPNEEPGGGSRGSATELHLVTANAWGLPDALAPRRASRMTELARWTEALGADVIGLQEMWRGAVPLTPLVLHRGETPWDDGLAFHTAHRLDQVEARPFRAARSFDALKTKGVLRARLVRDDGPPIWMFVTHLQSGHGAANARVREQQLDTLLGFLAETRGPAVVFGDFNADAQDPEDRPLLERIEAAGLVDAAALVEHPQPTYPGDGRRYDRIFLVQRDGWALVPEQVEVITFDDDPLSAPPGRFSDHLPVEARLRVVRVPTPADPCGPQARDVHDPR